MGGWRDQNGWRDSTDDDRSVASSADLRRMSMATVNTVDSDPGPVRTGRQRGSSIGINRATSVSSLRAAASGSFPRSARSSASFEAFTQDFSSRTTMVDALSDAGSPHLRMGSLSPGPGTHGLNHTHWGAQADLPQLVLNGQGNGGAGGLAARRIHAHAPMSFSSVLASTDEYGDTAMSPTPGDAYRGSMSPGSPYEAMSVSPVAGAHAPPQGMYNMVSNREIFKGN